MRDKTVRNITLSLALIFALTMVSCGTTKPFNSKRDLAGSKCESSHMTDSSRYFDDYEECKKL